MSKKPLDLDNYERAKSGTRTLPIGTVVSYQGSVGEIVRACGGLTAEVCGKYVIKLNDKPGKFLYILRQYKK